MAHDFLRRCHCAVSMTLRAVGNRDGECKRGNIRHSGEMGRRKKEEGVGEGGPGSSGSALALLSFIEQPACENCTTTLSHGVCWWVLRSFLGTP